MTTDPNDIAERRAALFWLGSVHSRSGWIFWYGSATGQYWAAHANAMMLICGDTPDELDRSIHRFCAPRHAPRGLDTSRRDLGQGATERCEEHDPYRRKRVA
ncbi:hypothetical protein [Nocardiopsis rhodophaea]|uniref:hypothetical protein n=1 Tax=Nocardiopsis rhodophaea TaxID=280238 RepID=UPI0031DE9A51